MDKAGKNVREVYDKAVRQLPARDRLCLASLILDDLAANNGADLDIRDDWTEQDMADLAAYSVKTAADHSPSEDGNA